MLYADSARIEQSEGSAHGRRDQRRTLHTRSDVEDGTSGRGGPLARRHDGRIYGHPLRHAGEQGHHGYIPARHGDGQRTRPDRHLVERILAAVEQRLETHLFSLRPQRHDAGVVDEPRRRRRTSGIRHTRGHRRLRHSPHRAETLLHAQGSRRRPTFGRRLQGYGQVAGTHIRRPDVPTLELLGRGRLQPYIHCRHPSRGPYQSGRHTRRGCRMGRPAGTLLRRLGDCVEPRRHKARIYMQEAHGYGLCRLDRLGHIRL